VSSAADERKERIARNETIFREVNERIEEVSANAPGEHVEFLCECGNRDCAEVVALARGEYEGLRADPVLFAVLPGHEIPEVEFVVAENERFLTVRKLTEEQEIARDTDPRAQA
jgi:hypothetical protein